MAKEHKSEAGGSIPPASSMLEQIGDVADAVREDLRRALGDVLTYLASPQGKRMRERLAMGLILVAPAVAKAPIVRNNPVFKLLGVAGGATLLVKIGEAIRDWEPQPAP